MKATEHEIESFRRFALEQIGNGGSELSIDELYDRWRLQCPSDEELQEDVLAVKASLRDMERGEKGRSFDEFSREFRARHHLTEPE